MELRIPRDLLVLIGANGAGKSSTLQALAFLRYFADGNAEQFFSDRGWSKREIRSLAGAKSNSLRYDVLLEDQAGRSLLWQFSWSLATGFTTREILWLQVGEDLLKIFDYRDRNLSFFDSSEIQIPPLVFKGSVTGSLKVGGWFTYSELLSQIASWGLGITSLELLSPIAMRRGARGDQKDIGSRGERLASFMASLNSSAKARVVDRLSEYYPLTSVNTTKKKAGWVDMRVSERFRGFDDLSATHVSDGFLRLLALCAIPEFSTDVTFILLDEVEDGIEPHVLPSLIKRVVQDANENVQFVMTSHSPLLVNYFPPDEIAFIGRADDGLTSARPLDKFTTIRQGVEYFGPGELWAMMSPETLQSEFGAAASDVLVEGLPDRFTETYAQGFLRYGTVHA